MTTYHDNPDEPRVRRASLPLVRMVDGVPHWYVTGSVPPRYERDATLEALWRAGLRAERRAA